MAPSKLVLTLLPSHEYLRGLVVSSNHDKRELEFVLRIMSNSRVLVQSEFPGECDIEIGHDLFHADGTPYSLTTHTQLEPGTRELTTSCGGYVVYPNGNMPDGLKSDLKYDPWLVDEWRTITVIDDSHVITRNNEIRGIGVLGAPNIPCPVPVERMVKVLVQDRSCASYLMAKLDDGSILYWSSVASRSYPELNKIKHQEYIDSSLGFYDFGLSAHGFVVVGPTVIRVLDVRGGYCDVSYSGVVEYTHDSCGNWIIISGVLYSIDTYRGKLEKLMSGVHGISGSVRIKQL